MIEQMTKGMRENVVALTAHGKVSHQDYVKVVIPAVEEKIRTHTKVRLFFHLGEDFAGYTAEAIWDDTKIGIQHLTAFEKIAVVTNVAWVKETVRLFGFIVPCPVKIFSNEAIAAAAAWVNE
ncbi:MAG: STAS/SEC14 domain-containing protein [Methylacidiphilales bacterium]|nr:STAS/SEC14 domain-containing protein [Candidatus Methylacidiphilales bacterium]